MSKAERVWKVHYILRDRDFIAALVLTSAVAGSLTVSIISGWIDDGLSIVVGYGKATAEAARWIGPVVLASALGLVAIYHSAASVSLQWKLFHFRRGERRAEQYLIVLWAPVAIGLGTGTLGWFGPSANGMGTAFSLATFSLLGCLWSLTSLGEAIIQTYRLSVTAARTGLEPGESP